MDARAMAFESECENLVRGLDKHGNIHPRALEWMNSVSIIPIASRSKKPPEGFLWKEYTERIATAEERPGWRKRWPSMNYGLVCGKISGVTVLDFDGPDGKQLFNHHQIAGGGPVNITANGFHGLFAVESEAIGNSTGVVPGLDVRGENGYILIPPSIHPSGVKYRWQVAPWMIDPPGVPDWAMELIRTKEAAERAVVRNDADIINIRSFDDFAMHHGCEVPPNGWIPDGRIHRCPAVDPTGRIIQGDGSYKVFLDHPIQGYIQNHHRHNQLLTQQWKPIR